MVWRSIHVCHQILPSDKIEREVRETKGEDDRCNDSERKAQQQVATCNRFANSTRPTFLDIRHPFLGETMEGTQRNPA